MHVRSEYSCRRIRSQHAPTPIPTAASSMSRTSGRKMRRSDKDCVEDSKKIPPTDTRRIPAHPNIDGTSEFTIPPAIAVQIGTNARNGKVFVKLPIRIAAFMKKIAHEIPTIDPHTAGQCEATRIGSIFEKRTIGTMPTTRKIAETNVRSNGLSDRNTFLEKYCEAAFENAAKQAEIHQFIKKSNKE